MSESVPSILQKMGFEKSKCEHSLTLDFSDIKLAVHTNSAEHANQLKAYFAHILVDNGSAELNVYATQSSPCQLDLAFQDWQREPGKTGRKDSFFDVADVRVLRKVRTGMVFLQSATMAVAAGPCVDNDNQVINFINSQYLTWLQQRNWLNCHAAALAYRGKGLALAGFSGGGKSTLMLSMLENDQASYVTNDRLLVQHTSGRLMAKGIAKLPRINPGTILNNPRLQHLIPDVEKDALLALPKQSLWDLEQKYDVDIQSLYGKGRIQASVSLNVLAILNWQRQSGAPVAIAQVELTERKDLLAAVMKSPGPFYQYPEGHFYRAGTALDEVAYLDTLSDVMVFEVTGGVDFDGLGQLLFAALESV